MDLKLKPAGLPNKHLAYIGYAVIIGVILGVISCWYPISLAFIGLIIFLFAAYVVPDFILLGILIITSTVIDYENLPFFSIGFGRLGVLDIVLLGSLGIIAVRRLTETEFRLVRTPLDLPLIGFYLAALFSTFISIFQSNVTFNQSLSEIRIINLFLTFFLTTNFIRKEKQLRRLLNGIIVLSLVVSVLMIVQSFFGSSIQLLTGRIETLQTADVVDYGVTRVLPPGQSLVMVVFILVIALIVIDKSHSFWTRVGILGFTGLAVIITFNRSFWVGIGVALFCLIIVFPWKHRYKLFTRSVLMALICMCLFAVVYLGVPSLVNRFFDGTANRFSTLVDLSAFQESSINDRNIENAYAIPQIIAHPIIGLGLGADYRPQDLRIDPLVMTWDRLNYIHNGHFWILLKTGLIGYLCFVFLSVIFIVRGLRAWKTMREPYFKSVMVSFVTVFIGLQVAALYNPIFRQSFWTAIIGIMMGTNEVMIKLNRNAEGKSELEQTS